MTRVAALHRLGWRRCVWCGRPCGTWRRRDGRSATVEHVVPLAVGGTDDPLNLAMAHRGCNTARGGRTDVAPHREVWAWALALGLVDPAWRPDEPSVTIADVRREFVASAAAKLARRRRKQLARLEARQIGVGTEDQL